LYFFLFIIYFFAKPHLQVSPHAQAAKIHEPSQMPQRKSRLHTGRQKMRRCLLFY